MKKPSRNLKALHAARRGARKGAKQAARRAALRARRMVAIASSPRAFGPRDAAPQLLNFPLTRPALPAVFAPVAANDAREPVRAPVPASGRHRAAAIIALPLLAVSFMAALTAVHNDRRTVTRAIDVAAGRAPLPRPWSPPVRVEPSLTSALPVSPPPPPLLATRTGLPDVAARDPGGQEALAARTRPPVGQQVAMLSLPVPASYADPKAPGLTSLAAREEPDQGPPVCMSIPAPPRPVRPDFTPAAFGGALASAAMTQTGDLVIYNDTYRHMSYPMGDVPKLYGVCTDVVIRAYRALGVDLQQLVHESGLGSGDTSIEHRRVETLRRFFARHGEQLPITAYAEDYLPGDVVTYNRPQNRHSRSHIAVVSNEIGASGRYKIIHNRGWGPQAEDALFVDEITGHYRYWTAPAAPSAQPSAKDGLAIAAGVAKSTPAAPPVRLVRASARPHPDGVTVRGLGR